MSEAQDIKESDWQCPLCLELLYKPCVNECGHVFCFWCTFRAMDPFTASRCPICRSAYNHLPHPVYLLHSFVKQTFPEQYALKEAETVAEELETQCSSPKMEDAPGVVAASKKFDIAPEHGEHAQAQAAVSPASLSVEAGASATATADEAIKGSMAPATVDRNDLKPGMSDSALRIPPIVVESSQPGAAPAVRPFWRPSDFCCSRPGCGKLLYQPAVLSCGHVVCKDTCTPAPASACAASSSNSLSPSSSNHPVSSSPAAAPFGQCPSCSKALVHASPVCGKLQDTLLQLFPLEMEQRKQEVQELLAQRGKEAKSNSSLQSAETAPKV